MSFIVGELSTPISADTKGFDRDIDRVRKTGEKTARTLSARFQQVGKSISNAGSIATRFVTGPLLAVGGGIMLLANRTANYADEIDKMSIRTGLATDTLQELRFAADQTGVEFDAVQGVIESFTRRIPTLVQGTSDSAREFQKLNIDLRDSEGNMRSMSSIFPAVIRQLASMENVTERNAVATQIFGRRAFEIVPLLDAGEKGIEQFTKRAHELGLVMSDEAIKTAVDYKDELSALKQEFGAVGRELAVKLMPVIKDELVPIIREELIPMFKSFVEWVAKTTRKFSELDQGTQKLIIQMGGLALVGGPVLKVIGGLIKGVVALKAGIAVLAAPLIALPAIALGAAEGLKRLLHNTEKNKEEVNKLAKEFIRLNPEAAKFSNEFIRSTDNIDDNTESIEDNNKALNDNVNTVGTLSEKLQQLQVQRDGILNINRELTASEYRQARALQMQADALEKVIAIRERMIQPVKELNTAERTYQTIISGIPSQLELVRAAMEQTIETIRAMSHAEYQALKWTMMRADETIKSARDVANAMIAEARRVIQAKFAEGMAGVLADAGLKFGILAPVVGVGIAGAFSAFWNKFIPKLAKGGIIPPGHPNDSFPAMLSSGEAVIPLDRHNEFIGGKEINLNIHLTGDVRARDNELAYIINQVIKKRARLT